MLWFKSFHLIFITTWFAALFYLPRLFVYHAEAQDATGVARFKVMERRLFLGGLWPRAAPASLVWVLLWVPPASGRGGGGWGGVGWVPSVLLPTSCGPCVCARVRARATAPRTPLPQGRRGAGRGR